MTTYHYDSGARFAFAQSPLLLRIMCILTGLALLPLFFLTSVFCVLAVSQASSSPLTLLFWLAPLTMLSLIIGSCSIAFFNTTKLQIVTNLGLVLTLTCCILVTAPAVVLLSLDLISRRVRVEYILFTVVAVLILGWFILLTQQLTRWSKRFKEGPANTCNHCGYNISMTIQDNREACPECGLQIPSQQVEAFHAMVAQDEAAYLMLENAPPALQDRAKP